MAFMDAHTPTMERLVGAEPRVDPGTAVVSRRQPRQERMYPAALNVRPEVQVGPQRAPDPIRQGDTPARPARVPIITFLSMASIRAVMSDFFRVSIIAPNHTAATPRGAQLPLGERVNIRRPPAQAYGSLYEADPPDRYALL